MKTIKSFPLKFYNGDVRRLLARHHVRRRDIDDLHVLIIRDEPNGGDDGYYRAVEQVLLLREPVELHVRAIGSGIKSPDDKASDSIGFLLALGWAFRRIGRKS